MKTPDISCARLRALLHYDSGTGRFSWIAPTNRRIRAGQLAGCTRSDGYVTIKVDGKIYLAHRLAWLYTHGALPEMDIDHVNGIPCDNRMNNLRLVTDSENMQNLHKPMSSNTTSGILGVSFDARRKRWVAQIRAGGVTRFLGRFNTPHAADGAYRQAKKQLHPTAAYGT